MRFQLLKMHTTLTKISNSVGTYYLLPWIKRQKLHFLFLRNGLLRRRQVFKTSQIFNNQKWRILGILNFWFLSGMFIWLRNSFATTLISCTKSTLKHCVTKFETSIHVSSKFETERWKFQGISRLPTCCLN